MFKDNAKNNYSSTKYAIFLIKVLIKRKKRKKAKKKHLHANGFKGLEKTITNNGV
jgi:chemotaxis receptor (MCP) glutamine deamidase CheD